MKVGNVYVRVCLKESMWLHLAYVVIVCVVSKPIESICIWFYSLELLCCGLIVVLGVKASLTLGREEKPWGEGVSWAYH